jgi:Mycolic acid cyclopropane synthetase
VTSISTRPAAYLDRWPDVALTAGSPARAAVARALFTAAAARLPLRVKLPDGRLLGAGAPSAPVMILHRPREFFRRVGDSGLIGFGESYMAGDWDCADGGLTGLLTVFAAHAGCSRSAPAGANWPSGPRSGVRRCSRSRSRGSSGRSPPAGWPRPAWAAGSGWNCATTATWTASSTRSARPKCSRRSASATGTPTSGPWTRHTYTWIQKYIFPGGLLPSVTAIENSLARTRLRITAREDFGAHYAETLRIWRERFGAHADEVARLGFDEVFSRMWTFYLCYSEAGFRAGYLDVSQLTLART